jgi:hypothetical protein
LYMHIMELKALVPTGQTMHKYAIFMFVHAYYGIESARSDWSKHITVLHIHAYMHTMRKRSS